MSSFIRQLNKYDFHKVKPSNDTDLNSPKGNVLEFKHPYFRVDSKDDLDNIRRKAPATRKPQAPEDFTTSQHVSVISEQLTATQQQVQQLQALFAEISQTNRVLVNEVLTLQKMLNAQKQAQHEMLNYLSPYHANGHNGAGNASDSNNTSDSGNAAGHDDAAANSGLLAHSMNTSHSDVDEAVPELRRARELLSSVAPDAIADRELERLHDIWGSPTDTTMVTPVSMPMLLDPMNDITRYPVYPVGQTVGIDPFHSDHIHKIPYAMPSDVSNAANARDAQQPHHQQQPSQHQQQHQQQQSGPASQLDSSSSASISMDKPVSLWGPKKPMIFLVEDDPTCAKIGIKFLKSMGCDVEHAQNGVEAYNRVNSAGRDHFDMIFMDIIMPRLDGVSATMYIRQQCPSTPVIAMTSNIRPDEVNGYFEHGMNGVLAKPFTKEGMLKSVKTHLQHLLKTPPHHTDPDHGPGSFIMGSVPYLNSTGTGIKFESPTPPSNPGGPSWPSAHMAQNGVDQSFGLLNGSNQYAMAQGPSRNAYPASDHDSPPEKRQRLNRSQHTYG
ncbi:Transcription factor SKN7 [Escovopsis weberi]|uniref:Transcription factor n=1 Tax=Escovopsis weberi TaxID=150374 RepID=A0A0M8MRP2_ESCWE|nr:Transcription factor SKN7 [Escovopsis weberi]